MVRQLYYIGLYIYIYIYIYVYEGCIRLLSSCVDLCAGLVLRWCQQYMHVSRTAGLRRRCRSVLTSLQMFKQCFESIWYLELLFCTYNYMDVTQHDDCNISKPTGPAAVNVERRLVYILKYHYQLVTRSVRANPLKAIIHSFWFLCEKKSRTTAYSGLLVSRQWTL